MASVLAASVLAASAAAAAHPRWALASLLAAFALSAPTPALSALPPNIVFILLDDVGHGDLGAYGARFVETPHIDQLAAEGQRFTHYRSSAPVCSPARVAILTGLYPIRAGIPDVLAADSWRGLPAGIATLADHLRTAGYATGHFGKWHLGENRPEYLPAAHGFDRSVIAARGGGAGGYVDPWLSIDGGPAFQASGHLTDLTTQHALEFIAKSRPRRFFANVWLHSPHVPYEPPPRWRERYPDTREGLYAAMLSHADEQIGRILLMLRLLGLDSRTLVLVASDNGDVRKAVPNPRELAGYKGSLLEGGLRVPLIASWGPWTPAGAENASPFHGIDFLPTLLEIAGVARPAGLPGHSMAAALRGETVAPARATFWEIPRTSPLPYLDATGPYRWAVLRGSWKLVQLPTPGVAAPRLFDLSSDPGETTDLAPLHPEIASELEREHRLWRLRESRLHLPIAQVGGAAVARGAWLDFAGGEVLLAPDARLGFHDGALSFSVRVLPAALGVEQTLAEQAGSWRLALTETGSVRFSALGDDGTPVEIESSTRLLPGVASDVAFTAFGRTSANAELRLLVDARVEAESREIRAVAASSAPLRIGNDARGEHPFAGRLWGAGVHLVSLQAAELADLDQDGVPNARDACLAEAEVAQRDSDADGIGDACDPDLDGDGVVGTADRLAFYRVFGSHEGETRYDPRMDFDGDGGVGFSDLVSLESAFGAPPGPSGRVCTPTEPCAAP